jgi:hypothetical protein
MVSTMLGHGTTNVEERNIDPVPPTLNPGHDHLPGGRTDNQNRT